MGSVGSSSGEEDGNEEWLAAIDSIASVGFSIISSTGASARPLPADRTTDDSHDSPRRLKLYQIKAQKLLDDLLESDLEIVRTPDVQLHESNHSDINGIKLFSKDQASVSSETQSIRCKRPRILPTEKIGGKSKKFISQINSIVVDGSIVIASATEACHKSFVRFEAKEAAVKVSAEIEDARILGLKKIRGEKWLPSIVKEMQGKTCDMHGTNRKS